VEGISISTFQSGGGLNGTYISGTNFTNLGKIYLLITDFKDLLPFLENAATVYGFGPTFIVNWRYAVGLTVNDHRPRWQI
jgi:hypothetical protein